MSSFPIIDQLYKKYLVFVNGLTVDYIEMVRMPVMPSSATDRYVQRPVMRSSATGSVFERVQRFRMRSSATDRVFERVQRFRMRSGATDSLFEEQPPVMLQTGPEAAWAAIAGGATNSRYANIGQFIASGRPGQCGRRRQPAYVELNRFAVD